MRWLRRADFDRKASDGRRDTHGYTAWVRAGIAFATTMMPFVAPATVLLAVRKTRFLRSDVLLLGSLLMYLALSAWHRSFDTSALAVFMAMLVGLGARSLFAGGDPERRVQSVATGVALGVLGLVGTAMVQIGVGESRAMGPFWFWHPNIFAHSLFATGALAAAIQDHRWRSIALVGATGLGLVLTGSRSALFGFTIMLIVTSLLPRYRKIAVPTLFGVIVLSAGVYLVAPGSPWAQRIASPVRVILPTGPRTNLLQMSEDLANETVWATEGSVLRLVAATSPATWNVEREAEGYSVRPQQALVLHPRRTYTMTIDLKAGEAQSPGVLAWGREEDGSVVELSVMSTGSGAVVLSSRQLVDVTATEYLHDDGWATLVVTFSTAFKSSTYVGLGPSPDLSSSDVGVSTLVRAFQLEFGDRVSDYDPTTRLNTGMGEALARLPLWRTAWSGFQQSPIAGHGPRAFAQYLGADSGTPAHPHNLLVTAAFEGGALGVIALGAFLLALIAPAGPFARCALIGLLVANFFDSTLYIAVVLFPAVVLANASEARHMLRARSDATSQVRGSGKRASS